MDGKDKYKVGFRFGKSLAKRYRRSHVFYGGFIEGWFSLGPNKPSNRTIKISAKTSDDAIFEANGGLDRLERAWNGRN